MTAAAFDGLVLYDFGNGGELSRVAARDADVSLVTNEYGPALRMEAGVSYDWPYVSLGNRDGWDLSAFGEISFTVKNLEREPMTVLCYVDSKPRGNSDSARTLRKACTLFVEAERRNTFHITLPSAPGVSAADFFGMRGVPFVGGDPLQVDHIVEIVIYVKKSDRRRRIEVGNITAQGAASAFQIPANPFPLIDEFGQFKHRDWPGKVHSIEDLHSRRDAEQKDMAAHLRPAAWNAYGGWKDGPTLPATGFFRTEKHAGKWHLVDPEGKLFFSQGIDVVNFYNGTPLDDRTHWFEKLPPDTPEYAEFYGSSRSHMMTYYYGGRTVRTFSFHEYNLLRKYGPEWKTIFYDLSHRRLASWGINTLGNWSSDAIAQMKRTPYVTPASSEGPVIEGSTGYWGNFPDVFAPAFAERTRAHVRRDSEKNANDPWSIGIFVDNELSWGDETSIGLWTLASPATQAAKIVFVEDLRARHGSIDALNVKWGTAYPSWNAVLTGTTLPSKEKACEDLSIFGGKAAETYFAVVRDAVKRVAPNQLYLGCRFSSSNPLAIKVAARYCDVVSFNIYGRSLKEARELGHAGDRSVIIGEFHFGALDRGQFHTGLVATQDQEDRARAYTQYVTECLAHPAIVGCHWFQYIDSPTTGRALDGENYQIGFLDNADTPYAEIIAASRKIGASMYDPRDGD